MQLCPGVVAYAVVQFCPGVVAYAVTSADLPWCSFILGVLRVELRGPIERSVVAGKLMDLTCRGRAGQ